ncbi:receptor-interacting serine/threonine-protein kinase 3-like isoform X2 [Pleurodeles waltl]|uniref:receptor-interacting serine/threonine-protein kinase 3-like isoform X2 n=1 Tax=Pleurodeles waltl TaxID=8319 RepID=UPI0037099E2C
MAEVFFKQTGALRLPVISLADLEEPRVWIGRGGFSDIYRSRKWGLQVALKVIRGSRETEKELMKEVVLMERAPFVYILHLLAIYSNPDEHVEYGLVTQYMRNGSLCTLFSKVSPLPWPLKFRILNQVAAAMYYLHDLKPPLLHLDLKPSNVLLDDYFIVKLTDFGLSKLKISTASSNVGGFAGTYPYMPPEAFTGGNCRKETFDVYSFGVLTWALLAEKEPYQGKSCFEIMFQVPKGLRPDMEELDSLDDMQMLPYAKVLMTRCWEMAEAARPTFKECTAETKKVWDVYEDKIDSAVQCVQEQLKNNAKGEVVSSSRTCDSEILPSSDTG